MIAVSLNVGGGVRLIKSVTLYMCTQKHNKHNEDGRTAPGVCGNGSVPLSHSGNVVTRIGIHTHPIFCTSDSSSFEIDLTVFVCEAVHYLNRYFGTGHYCRPDILN